MQQRAPTKRNPTPNSAATASRSQSPAKPPRTKKRRSASKDPTTGLAVANPNAAAIDVGCAEHWVAVPPGRAEPNVRCFGCTTPELERLVAWLKLVGVDTVVLEATGNYWVVLYDLLEQHGLNPVVVNPRYAKNMSGKKGDIPDCQWMQKLHTYGLFANSFRPSEPFRVLRAYLRQREQLVGAASQAIQHMQKALTEMNIQLANVISDITGQTGLAIIDAILAGERDAQKLVGLRDQRIKASVQSLLDALQGHWKEEQLFALEQARLTFAHYQEQIASCQERLQSQMRAIQSRLPAKGGQPAPKDQPDGAGAGAFDVQAELRRIAGVDLLNIDGLGPVTVAIILSEIGTDMSYWPTEKHLASWLGLCPDHRISGGKILGRSTRPVVSRARNALRLAASSLERSQSWLGAKYRRFKAKLGAPKAIIAMAHQLARLIYRMLKYGHEYVDKGVAAYEAKYREQRVRWIKKQAHELNLQVVEA